MQLSTWQFDLWLAVTFLLIGYVVADLWALWRKLNH